MRLTKEELIRRLRSFPGDDKEIEHALADQLLLDFIDDDEITDAFESVDKWYA